MIKLPLFFVLAIAIVVPVRPVHASDKGPKAANSPPATFHPESGYAFELEPPTPGEQAGLRLRFSFAKLLRYQQTIVERSFLGSNPLPGGSSTTEVDYLLTEKPDLFVVKPLEKAETHDLIMLRLQTGVVELNARGEMKLKDPAISNFIARVEGKGLFPEKSVKTGDTWEEHYDFTGTTAKGDRTNSLDSTTQWKFAGMTTVRGHRCVVLDGNESAHYLAGDKTGKLITNRTARRVYYFDYHLGGIVERVEFYHAETPITTSRGKPNPSMTVKASGQSILTLLE